MLGKKLILLSFCGFLAIDAFAQREKDVEVDLAGLPRPDFSTSANESADDESEGCLGNEGVRNVPLGRHASYQRRYSENYDGVRGDQVFRRLLSLIRRCDPRANKEVERLLEQHPELLNRHGGRHGVTPLHVAASSGNLSIIYLLLALRADVNVRTSSGYLPVHGAIMHGDNEIAKTLLLNGTDLDDIGPEGDLVATAEFHHQGRIAHFIKLMQKVEAKHHGELMQDETSDDSSVTSTSSSSSSESFSYSSSSSDSGYSSSSSDSESDTEEYYLKAHPKKGQLQVVCHSAQFGKAWKQAQEQEKKDQEQAEQAKKQAEEVAVLAQVANFLNAINAMSAVVPDLNKVPTKTGTVPSATKNATDQVIPEPPSDIEKTLEALDEASKIETEGAVGTKEPTVEQKGGEGSATTLEEEIEKLLKTVAEIDAAKNHSESEAHENKTQDE